MWPTWLDAVSYPAFGRTGLTIRSGRLQNRWKEASSRSLPSELKCQNAWGEEFCQAPFCYFLLLHKNFCSFVFASGIVVFNRTPFILCSATHVNNHMHLIVCTSSFSLLLLPGNPESSGAKERRFHIGLNTGEERHSEGSKTHLRKHWYGFSRQKQGK